MKNKLNLFAATVGVAAATWAMFCGYRMLFYGKGTSSAEARLLPAENGSGRYSAHQSHLPDESASASSTGEMKVAVAASSSPRNIPSASISNVSTATTNGVGDIATGITPAAKSTSTAGEISAGAGDEDLPYCP